jgi:hypothetical protein
MKNANAATKKLASTAHQEVASVVRVGPEGIDLASPDGPYRAKRAAGCLLAPEAGDRVLVAIVSNGSAYVISVLEREEGATAVLDVEGDLAIRAPRGRVAITGGEGLDLLSARDTNLVGEELNLRGSRGSVVLEHLALLAGSALAEVKSARLVADAIDTAAERLVQRVKRAYRFIEGAEHVRAETVDYVATKELCLRGDQTVIMADQLVKVDGAQIHVG